MLRVDNGEDLQDGESDDWVWDSVDCGWRVGILCDGEHSSYSVDPDLLWAGAGVVGDTGAYGRCQAPDAVDARRGDGGAAWLSGGGRDGNSLGQGAVHS